MEGSPPARESLDAAAKLGEHRSVKRIATALILTLGLGACTTPSLPRIPGMGERTPKPDAPAAPAAPDGPRDWIFNVDGAEAYLAYGTPESDDLEIGFRCTRDGPFNVTQVTPEKPRNFVIVYTRKAMHAWPAADVERDQLGGGWLVTAEVQRGDAGMAAFREDGWLSVRHGEKTVRLIPQKGTTAVTDFFQWCG